MLNTCTIVIKFEGLKMDGWDTCTIVINLNGSGRMCGKVNTECMFHSDLVCRPQDGWLGK